MLIGKDLLRRTPAIMVAVLVLALVSVACGGADEAKPAGLKTGGTLRVGMVADTWDFDGPTVVNMTGISGLPHVYDNLVLRNPDDSMRPMLAVSWETRPVGNRQRRATRWQ